MPNPEAHHKCASPIFVCVRRQLVMCAIFFFSPFSCLISFADNLEKLYQAKGPPVPCEGSKWILLLN